jgi:uncharacterized protein DUF4339
MRWLVNSNGQTSGPMDDAMVTALIRAGQLGESSLLREESSESWMPLAQTPFVAVVAAPAPPQPGGEALGFAILLSPIVAGVLVWLWIANMNLLQDPASTLQILTVLTIVGTATLIAVEASQLGMGKRTDSRGKKGTGAVAWFCASCLIWFIAFPWYLDQRRYYGRKPLAIGGVLAMLFFIGSTFIIGAAIENKKAEVRASFNQAEASLTNFSIPTPAAVPTVDHGSEIARFVSAKRRLKTNPPKTGGDLLQMLGEPTTTMDMPGSKMYSWYYETKEIGRDVIVASVGSNGRVNLVQY